MQDTGSVPETVKLLSHAVIAEQSEIQVQVLGVLLSYPVNRHGRGWI